MFEKIKGKLLIRGVLSVLFVSIFSFALSNNSVQNLIVNPLQDNTQLAQVIPVGPQLILHDGDTMSGSLSWAENVAEGGISSSTGLKLLPDAWHSPNIRLTGDAWRADFADYDRLEFYFRSPEVSPGSPTVMLKAWPDQTSNTISILDYIDGGVIDNTWRKVTIPILDLVADWELNGVEDVVWSLDGNNPIYYVDDLKLVGEGDPWNFIDVSIVEVRTAARE